MQFDRISNLTLGLLDKEHEVSEEAHNALRRLNSERQACQDNIGRLDLPSFADCETCKGKCCDKPPDHYFTPIDFWLTKCSDGQAHSFTEASIKPFYYYYKVRFKYFFKKLFRLRTESQAEDVHKVGASCVYLGENGCKLPHSERPIKCLIFACTSLKDSLDDVTRAAYLKEIKELYRISLQTFDVLKAETRYPAYYGYVSLALIP